MEVESVQAMTAVVPVEKRGLSISTRTLNERHYLFVRVRTDTGAEGIGFSYIGTRAGRIAALAVRELFADLVVGRDAHQTEGIWDSMYREALLQGRRGFVVRAISAMDATLKAAAASSEASS